MNIGFHFFDLLCWVFGDVSSSLLVEDSPSTLRGELTLARADVSWELSVDSRRIPALSDTAPRESAHRTLAVNGLPVDLSPSFLDLHTRVYQEILDGKGPGINDVRPATEAIHALRRRSPLPSK
jgi:UDP-N-acetyl-2-amino-2-deoxyglucuronate dehydrogenase